MNGPFGAGNGPGERRSFGGPRRSGHHSAPKLSPDDVDAMLATLGRVRFVAFDFETTGLSAERDRVVEIGAIAFRLEEDNGQWKAIPDGAYESLINPGCPIPPETSAIHGIDDLSVSAAPSFKAASADFLPFIAGSILVAHNAPFDTSFLRAESIRAGLEPPMNPAYDTIAIAKSAISGLPSYSLKSLATAFRIQQNAAHRGGDDARVCMELFILCVNLIHKAN